MATFTKVNDWVLNLHEVVDIDGDTLKFELTSTAPTAGTDVTGDGNGVIANVSPISYTNYTDDLTADRTFTSGTLTHTQTAGTFTLDYGADIVITASGGAVASWQYIVPFDDTPTSPADPVINFWDHGSAIVLGDGDSATIAFNASGWYTLS